MYKKFLMFSFLFVLCVSSAFAQRINKISSKCPTGVAGSSLIIANNSGDIVHTPCAGSASIFNGNVDLTGATVTGVVGGSGTTDFVPRWSSTSVLTDTPFSWNGTSYFFNQSTGATADFNARITPSVSGNGIVLIGDCVNSPTTCLSVDQNAATTSLSAGSNSTLSFTSTTATLLTSSTQIFRGASQTFSNNAGTAEFAFVFQPSSVSGNASIGDCVTTPTTCIAIGQGSNTITLMSDVFTIGNAGTTSSFGLTGVGTFLLNRTITAGGTTGAQVINKPAGTVNFAAAATSLVVTNSTVTTSSIIFAQARTNDSTCSVKNVVAGAGSFTINMTSACTAETSVGFKVTN